MKVDSDVGSAKIEVCRSHPRGAVSGREIQNSGLLKRSTMAALSAETSVDAQYAAVPFNLLGLRSSNLACILYVFLGGFLSLYSPTTRLCALFASQPCRICGLKLSSSRGRECLAASLATRRRSGTHTGRFPVFVACEA